MSARPSAHCGASTNNFCRHCCEKRRGVALGIGARGMVLVNQKGAVLQLSGQQIGLMANADLSGLAILMR